MDCSKEQIKEAFQNLSEECGGKKRVELGEQPPELNPTPQPPANPVQKPTADKSKVKEIDDQMASQWWGVVKKLAPSFIKILNISSHYELTKADNVAVVDQNGRNTQKTLFDHAYEELKNAYNDMLWFYADKARENVDVYKERIDELYKQTVQKLKDTQRRRLLAASYGFPADSADIHNKFMKQFTSGKDASGKQAGLHEEGCAGINNFLDNKGAFYDTRR